MGSTGRSSGAFTGGKLGAVMGSTGRSSGAFTGGRTGVKPWQNTGAVTGGTLRAGLGPVLSEVLGPLGLFLLLGASWGSTW